MSQGWIKIDRSILEHWIWQDEKYFRWWMTILLKVNHDSKKFPVNGEIFICNPGESFRSIDDWGRLFGCSTKTVLKFFDLLKSDGMITAQIIGSGNRRKHLLSVANWQKFQQTENENSRERKTKKAAFFEKNDDKKTEKGKRTEPATNKGFSDLSITTENENSRERKTKKAAFFEKNDDKKTEKGKRTEPATNKGFSDLSITTENENSRERKTETPVNVIPNKNDKEININNISIKFEEFRKMYPGSKSGSVTELQNFLKKNKPETVDLLLPALGKEISHKSKLRSQNKFCPEWKNLQTWINKKCWEQELPEVEETNFNSNKNGNNQKINTGGSRQPSTSVEHANDRGFGFHKMVPD